MNLSAWTILFLAVAAQGIFLGLILLTRKKHSRGNHFYLGTFIILFSIVLLFWVGYWNRFEEKSAHFNFLYNPIPYLIGPFLYLYVKSFFKKIKKIDLLHFAPFILVFLYFAPFYFLTESQKIETLKAGNFDKILWNAHFLFKLHFGSLYMLSYAVYCYAMFVFIKRNTLNTTSEEEVYIKKWLKLLVVLFCVFTCSHFLSFLFNQILKLPIEYDYFAALVVLISFYSIGYIGLNHSKYVKALEATISKKYNRSALNVNDAPQLIKEIIEYIEAEKVYLNENYKLAELSKGVGIPTHHISELLNSYHDKNFSELINHYRIEEAKKLLVSGKYDHKKVSVIGYDVGFNSRTSFYQWFKKLTGESPASYKKNKT